MLKKKLSMIRKYHNHELLRPAHGTVRKSNRTFTVTRYPKDNESKATSSLFLIKILENKKAHTVMHTKTKTNT